MGQLLRLATCHMGTGPHGGPQMTENAALMQSPCLEETLSGLGLRPQAPRDQGEGFVKMLSFARWEAMRLGRRSDMCALAGRQGGGPRCALPLSPLNQTHAESCSPTGEVCAQYTRIHRRERLLL